MEATQAVTPHPYDVQTMTEYYLECALRAYSEELPEGVIISDIVKRDRCEAQEDCRQFLERFPEAAENPIQAGYDLWLTRNHHGTGFWDRPEIWGIERSKEMTAYADSLGELQAQPHWRYRRTKVTIDPA